MSSHQDDGIAGNDYYHNGKRIARDLVRECHHGHKRGACPFCAVEKPLHEEIARLRRALSFYADQATWSGFIIGKKKGAEMPEILKDVENIKGRAVLGKLARSTLNED